jgi:hypothetical protein
MRILAALLLLSSPLAAQTLPLVLTCSSAAPGTPLVPWPNCAATAYKPAAPGLIVAIGRAGKALWEPSAAIVSTDSVFTNTAYNGTTSDWWPSSKFTWVTPVVPPPVIAPATVTGITISWTAPTKSTNGAALTNLAGYRIYEGQTVITIANPAATSYTLPILPAGKYLFSLTSFTTAGVESTHTSPFLVTIPEGVQPTVQTNTVMCNPQS